MSKNPFFEHEGKKYARVTSIISEPGKFDYIDPAVLEMKANIGTDVHNCIEADILGGFQLPELKSVPYVNSFRKWREAVDPIFLQSEQRYFDDERMVTGEVDCIATIQGSEPTLIDWKTSAIEDKIAWPRQAHLYYQLLKSAGKYVSNRFLFVKLDRKGGLPQVYEYKFSFEVNSLCNRLVKDFWSCHSTSVD